MHASVLIAGLAATAVSATPLIAREFGNKDGWTATTAFPDGQPIATPPPAPASSAPAQLGKPGKPNPVTPQGLVGELLTEASTVARFQEIKSEIDAGAISLKFDHNPAANPNVTAGMGGQVDLANRANFPVLTGLGISSATIFFQPCGLNTPHIHPRATEYFTLATDTKMSTGFVLENGLTDEFKVNDLSIWQGTVFPQGSIHWQQNLDCKPAVGVAGLNSEDPGASSIAQNFLRFTSPDVVDAALGFPAEINGGNFAQFASKLPASLSKGVKECLIRCQIPH